MQTFNFRNQLNIRGSQIRLFIFLCLGLGTFASFGQNTTRVNIPDYDEQWIHYGFAMSGHSSRYQIKYSENFTSPLMDTVHSIIPGNLGGFKLGFVVNIRLFQYLDFRVMPTVGFYENDLTYRFTSGTTLRELKDATMMEMPLLLKYKSTRRGNVAMYVVGGVNPMLEAAGRGDEQSNRTQLELRNFNFALEVGAGFDLYFPLFKFSPEIRYSHGLRNMLNDTQNRFSVNLEEVVIHNIALFITFEGGPSYLKRGRRR
jgi:hypothetical protein